MGRVTMENSFPLTGPLPRAPASTWLLGGDLRVRSLTSRRQEVYWGRSEMTKTLLAKEKGGLTVAAHILVLEEVLLRV